MPETTKRVEYRDIPGFPGYRVGDDGTVWSCWKRRGLGPGNGSTFIIGDDWHQLQTRFDKAGYRTLRLCRKGHKKKFWRVARLVCHTFYGPGPDGMEALHENGERSDDRKSNLRWGTSKENQEDRRRHGTLPMGVTHVSAKLTDDAVREIVHPGSVDMSYAELGRKFGVTPQCIAAVRYGKTWRHITGLVRKTKGNNGRAKKIQVSRTTPIQHNPAASGDVGQRNTRSGDE